MSLTAGEWAVGALYSSSLRYIKLCGEMWLLVPDNVLKSEKFNRLEKIVSKLCLKSWEQQQPLIRPNLVTCSWQS